MVERRQDLQNFPLSDGLILETTKRSLVSAAGYDSANISNPGPCLAEIASGGLHLYIHIFGQTAAGQKQPLAHVPRDKLGRVTAASTPEARQFGYVFRCMLQRGEGGEPPTRVRRSLAAVRAHCASAV